VKSVPRAPETAAHYPDILAGFVGLCRRWRKRWRDRADLAAMSESERHDIGYAAALTPEDPADHGNGGGINGCDAEH
jgi:uncharacterized protein YjiS (DUF1127 family)